MHPKTLSTTEYIQKILTTPRQGEENFLAFYDHKTGCVCTNPRLMLIPPDDHMVHRGDGVFETIKAEDGRLYQLDAHLARLKNSAASRNILPPSSFEEIKAAIVSVAQAGKEPNCYIRVLIGRGGGGFGIDPAECPIASLYIIAYHYKKLDESVLTNGLTAFRSSILAKPECDAHIKSTNYAGAVAMIEEAKTKGYDIAIAFDSSGYLAEAAIANVCLVNEAHELIVPPFTHALPGTTILKIMELAKSLLPVKTQKITESDVFKAKELLLTGSTSGCVSLVKYNGQPIGTGKPGATAKQIRELLKTDLLSNGLAFME